MRSFPISLLLIRIALPPSVLDRNRATSPPESEPTLIQDLTTFVSFISTQAIILVESHPLMYSPPSIILKGFLSLLFLIQYAMANDLGLQAFYQEDSVASPPLVFDNKIPAISDPSQFTTPFTSDSTSSKSPTDPSETYPQPQDGNDPENVLLSNEYCSSAAEQSYPSRRLRKRQNRKDFCDNPAPGASHRLENNNPIANPKSPTQNSVPGPNGSDKPPKETPDQEPEGDESELLRMLLDSLPGTDGEPDPTVCNNPEYPLFQVPVCAIQVPDLFTRRSPAPLLVGSRMCK